MARGTSPQQPAGAQLLSALATPVEVLALPEAYSLVEKANLTALLVALQLPDLYDEVALLQRLAYKNKNQHRSSKHHQAVCQVLRVLQLFRQLQLPDLLQQLHTAAQRTSLPEVPSAPAAVPSKRARRQPSKAPQAAAAAGGASEAAGAAGMRSSSVTQRQAVLLPSFQAGCFVLRRLLSGAQLLVDLHFIILTAGQHLSGQLSRGYFMPFCLVAAAAVARIRVLATAALLELLQVYNSLVQLLPLLPAAAATACASSSIRLLSVGSQGLPQMLQLSWSGPTPGLRCIQFDQQGAQSLQGQAAALQQTFCISASNNSSSSGASAPDITQQHLSLAGRSAVAGAGVFGNPGGRAAGLDDTRLLQPAAASADVSDVGVAISREAFALQQGQQQERQGKQRVAKQQPGQQRGQQQQGRSTPAIAISVFEDKQPGMAAITAADGGGAGAADMAAQPGAASVPLYSTVPGLGFSLGQRQNPLSSTPGMAQAAAAHARAPLLSSMSSAGGPGASAGGCQAMMDIDGAAQQDDQEFLALYGVQPTPPQGRQQQHRQAQELVHQHGHSSITGSASTAAGLDQPRVRQHTTEAQPQVATGTRRYGLHASAAVLAMQGPQSSDDEDDMMELPRRAQAGPAAAQGTAGNTAAPVHQHQQQQPLSGVQAQVQSMQVQESQQAHQVVAQQAAATAAKASVAAPAANLSAATPSARVAAATTAAAGGTAVAPDLQAAALLHAAKKGKQKKKAKQQQAAKADKEPADDPPRDVVLDLLLQGL